MYSVFKRLCDLIFSFVALIFAFPIIFIFSVVLYFFQRSNPFFTQVRPGKYGKLFKIYKLKTMTEEKDVHGVLLPDSLRLTTIGKIVRKLSIDELPQLYNVFIGNMSFVGPRPLLLQYLPLYNEEQSRRHSVKPGITGWAQINGRNAISWEQKFIYDVWYVDNQSFLIDIRILLSTIKNIFFTKDVNQNVSTTMDYFKGNQ
jgi:lipopolysaccharide/colanic/teichoic acid biosynthesis glycosyltransferase